MPGPITVYPDTVNHYQAGSVGLTWSQLRDGDSSVVTGVGVNPTTARHFITDNGLSYSFMRTYIQFDLSSIVDPILSMRLYVQGVAGFTTGNTTYVAYAGNKNGINNDSNDYGVYLNVNATTELSTIIVQPDVFTSCELDITTYPPANAKYVVGLVTQPDFLNDVNTLANEVRIHNSVGKIPYLIINGGYPNDVNGIAGTSMVEVSGVLNTNIVSIAGV